MEALELWGGGDWRVIFNQEEATTELYDAVQKGNEELIKTCIANGANTQQSWRVRERPRMFFSCKCSLFVYILPRPKSLGGDWLREE